MARRILLRGGCVLSLDPRVGNHREADVLIDGDTIAEIGQGLRARDAEVIEAGDTIVMPGFVDSHRHVWESLFRGMGDTSTVSVSGAGVAAHYAADDIYAATLVGLLGAAEAGITSVVDWFDLPPGEGHLEAVLQAHFDSGMRTVLVQGKAAWSDDDAGWRAGLRDIVDTSGAPLLTRAAGPGEPSPGRADDVAADWGLARELGLRIHTHVGMTADHRGVVADLDRRGLLGEDVTLVHCSHLDDADLDAVASSSAAVALTPASEMAGGLGVTQIQGLIDRGIRPGLGVDTELVAPGDLFAQMRAVISLQHATLFDLKLAGKAGIPRLLSTREVIRYATVDGARAAGLAGSVGALAPGMQADLVLLRTDRPNIFPINDPIGAVVWGMDTSNIDWVFVAGRALVSNGALGADLGQVRQLAETARHRVAGAAGLLAGIGETA